MKKDALTHPKMFDLASRLGISRCHAVGVVTLLLDFTATHAPQGDIGKWADSSIAGACDWIGDPQAFVSALVDSGWIDEVARYRLVIHDWHAHCENWVRAKVAKAKLDFVSVTTLKKPLKKPLKSEQNGFSSRSPLPSVAKPSLAYLEANASCDEAAKPHSPPSPFTFPTRGTVRQWNLPEAKLAEYLESYPGLDVAAELRSAVQWCRDNGTKQKTASGMPAFLSRWLAKAANSGHSTNGKPAKPQSRVLEPHEYHLYDPHSPTGMRDE